MNRGGRRGGAALWTAFLMAGVLEMLVFSFVDPGELRPFGGEPLDWSATAVYTASFFVFWAVIAFAALLAAWLDAPASEVNAGSAP